MNAWPVRAPDRQVPGADFLFRPSATDLPRDRAPSGVAALSLAQAIPPSGAAAVRNDWKSRWALDDIDWAPDLGDDIGSRTWWRGLGTLVVLCGTAIALWPGIRPVEAMAAPLDPADQHYVHAQAITPLAWGADTGRRMAPTDAVQPLAFAPERPRIELTATLGQGDSFVRLLERSGVSGGEAARIAAMVGAAVPVSDIPAGTKLDIVLGRRAARTDPRPLENLAFRAALDLRLEIARSGGALSMDRIAIAVDNTPLRIRGRVGDRGLYLAARAAGAPASAIQSYLRTIAGQMPIREMRSDDEFDIIVSHRRAETGETEVGELIYAALHRGGTPRLRMIPWTIDGQKQWYEASGVGQQRSSMAWPTNGRLTSPFGMRVHPILRYRRMHWGVDIGAPHGSPIYAAMDGRVELAGWRGGGGNTVKLSHSGGLGTGYLHMSRIAVSPGQQVRRGQIVGYVGSTGLSTGPHLHYEVYRNGSAVNPSSISMTTRSMLEGEQLRAFRARLAEMAAIPVGAAMRAPVRSAAAPAVPAPLAGTPRPVARAAR